MTRWLPPCHSVPWLSAEPPPWVQPRCYEPTVPCRAGGHHAQQWLGVMTKHTGRAPESLWTVPPWEMQAAGSWRSGRCRPVPRERDAYSLGSESQHSSQSLDPALLFKGLKVGKDCSPAPHPIWGVSPFSHSFQHRLSFHMFLFPLSLISILDPAMVVSYLPSSSHLFSPSAPVSCYPSRSAARAQVPCLVAALTAGEGAIFLERDGAIVSRRQPVGHTVGRRSHREDNGSHPEVLLGARGLMGWDRVDSAGMTQGGLILGRTLLFHEDSLPLILFFGPVINGSWEMTGRGRLCFFSPYYRGDGFGNVGNQFSVSL